MTLHSWLLELVHSHPFSNIFGTMRISTALLIAQQMIGEIVIHQMLLTILLESHSLFLSQGNSKGPRQIRHTGWFWYIYLHTMKKVNWMCLTPTLMSLMIWCIFWLFTLTEGPLWKACPPVRKTKMHQPQILNINFGNNNPDMLADSWTSCLPSQAYWQW